MDILSQIMSLKTPETEASKPEKSAEQIAPITALPAQTDEDPVVDENFSYDGYQVVRGEFFAHINEPSLSFNLNKINVNKASLKRLPDTEYVQILVNPEDKKLVIRPADEDSKDAFLWCSTKGEKRQPKQITGRVFFAMVVKLMGWNPDYRYKMLGKLIRSGEEKLLAFDLTAAETYTRTVREDGKSKTSRKPVFPAEWEGQFGLPVEEHRKQLQINIFDGYTVFAIQDSTAAETTKPADTGTEG